MSYDTDIMISVDGILKDSGKLSIKDYRNLLTIEQQTTRMTIKNFMVEI